MIVGAPFVVESDGKVRLCASVRCEKRVETLYYEFDSKYKEYLCWERSDPFFLGLFQYAMLKDIDIVCEAPITEDLYYQIARYYMPVLSLSLDCFHQVEVQAPLAPPVSCVLPGVGAGISCGVDSFYTIMKMKDEPIEKFRLTFLLFANVNALTIDLDTSRQIFESKADRYSEIAEELGLDFVGVNTNYLIFHRELLERGVTSVSSSCKTCSCVFAIQKMVSVYYYSSSDSLDKFLLDERDPTRYDLFTLKELTTTTIRFYSSGVEELTRIGKVKAIGAYDLVKKNLCVCAGYNCGRCAKCLRTQAELYALGVLDEYREVFDVKDFCSHLAIRLGKLFSYPSEREDGYVREILDTAHKNGVRIPLSAHMASLFFFRPAGALHRALKKRSWYRRIYYGKGVDEIVAGRKAAELNRPKDFR